MKKTILAIFIFCGLSQFSNAQSQFGIKAGVNYNSNSIKEVKTDVFSGAKSKTGYHAGIWLRFNLPESSLYIRPELMYTDLKNETTYTQTIGGGAGTRQNQTVYSFQKIDVPILIGAKIFDFGTIFIGPSFQYILDSEFDIADIKDVDSDGFTVGLQMGAGIEFGSFGVDVRWERGFSDKESSFFDGTSDVTFDTRVNQIIVGVSLKL